MDGTPALNLASFVTTFMEEEAEKLMTENLSKNFIDFEEYPQTAELSVSFYSKKDNMYMHLILRLKISRTDALILLLVCLMHLWTIPEPKH